MFFLPAFLLAGIAAVFVVWLGTFIWQIFLSKADNPWLGLILPGITFGLILYISTMAPDISTAWYGLSRGRTMAERFIVIGGSLFFSFGAFYFCRQSCAYYDTLRWNAFLRIRSDFVCWLFISPAIKARNGINRGHLVYVAPQDEHKITALGLLSHLIVDSLAIRYIFVSVQYGLFQMQPFDAVQKAAVYLVLAAMTAAIASTINQSKVG